MRAAACSGERVGTGGEGTESVVKSDDSDHRDLMDQREGSHLVLYSFPELSQMAPSPGPELRIGKSQAGPSGGCLASIYMMHVLSEQVTL